MRHLKIYLCTIMIFSVLALGSSHVFADTETDVNYPTGNSNYANTGIGKINCANYGGDNDGDGICDSWEVSTPDPSDNNFAGLRVSFTDPSNPAVTYKYKLACNTSISGDCPSPAQKDVYTELDWMNNHDPDPTAIADVVNAFRNAPTPIYLHVQDGEDPTNPTFSQTGNIQQHFNNVRVYSANLANYYVSYLKLKQTYFGTISERQNTSSASCPSNSTPSTIPASYSYNCLTAKRQVFHYGMFVNTIYSAPSSNPEPSPSGWAEIIGNDYFMSLGGLTNGKGSIDEQESSFMHELGHNLGLWHGGMTPPTGIQDDDNCKPNYLSVMSYTYEFRKNSDICRPLDFSRSALNTLNENSLADSAIGSYQYPANNPPPPAGTISGQPSSCPANTERPIWFSTPSGIKQGITGSIINDWNQNGQSDSGYAQNVNKLSLSGGGCTSSASSNLSGYNDWANLYFSFQNSGNFNGGIVPAESEVNGTEITKLGIPVETYDQLPQNDTVEGTGFVADEQANDVSVQPVPVPDQTSNAGTIHEPTPEPISEYGLLAGIIIAVSVMAGIAAARKRPGKS